MAGDVPSLKDELSSRALFGFNFNLTTGNNNNNGSLADAQGLHGVWCVIRPPAKQPGTMQLLIYLHVPSFLLGSPSPRSQLG